VNTVIYVIQDQLRSGGTERQSLLLTEALREHGYDARLLLFSPGGRLADRPLRMNLPIHTLQSHNIGIPVWAPGLCSFLEQGKAAFLICMGRSANCYAGRLQRRFPSVPVIGTLRTGKWVLPWQRSSWKQIRALFVNCEWWKEELVRQGLNAEMIRVQHNPLAIEVSSDEKMQEDRRWMREKFNVADETPVAIQVAGFRRGKRQRILLEAMHLLHREYPDLPWQLWLLGEGPHWDKCRRLVDRYGLGERVSMFGYVDDPLPFYAAADCAFSCSAEDALPNFLIEAQACGLPVVAMDYRGVKECFLPGKSGYLVENDDLDLFKNRVYQLISDKSERRSMSEHARQWAPPHFDPKVRLKEWVDDLKLVGGKA
jgi:glycosyltransferase involved in cell wall biosynthesis